jgi:hypothetical protein
MHRPDDSLERFYAAVETLSGRTYRTVPRFDVPEDQQARAWAEIWRSYEVLAPLLGQLSHVFSGAALYGWQDRLREGHERAYAVQHRLADGGWEWLPGSGLADFREAADYFIGLDPLALRAVCEAGPTPERDVADVSEALSRLAEEFARTNEHLNGIGPSLADLKEEERIRRAEERGYWRWEDERRPRRYT